MVSLSLIHIWLLYLSAVFGVLTLLFSLLTVLITRRRLHVRCRLTTPSVPRGEYMQAELAFDYKRLPPISPVLVIVRGGDKLYECAYERFPARAQISLPAPHVGVVDVGIESWVFSDIFGLFEIRVRDVYKRQALCCCEENKGKKPEGSKKDLKQIKKLPG